MEEGLAVVRAADLKVGDLVWMGDAFRVVLGVAHCPPIVQVDVAALVDFPHCGTSRIFTSGRELVVR